MPLMSIGDLNTGRALADDFILHLVRRRSALGTLEYRVRASLAVLAGGQVIKNYHLEDITAELSASQRAAAANLTEGGAGIVKGLLGL